MSAAGFLVKIATAGEGQTEATNVEAVLFGSARANKPVKDALKAIADAEIRIASCAARLRNAAVKMEEDGTEESIEAVKKASENFYEAETSLPEAVFSFFVAGLVAGGTDVANAERLASFIGGERFTELRNVCLLGSGVADFSRPISRHSAN